MGLETEDRHEVRHRTRWNVPGPRLPDHTSVPRKLSEIQGDDPLILTLARGHYCPKEHQQHLELAANYPQIAVGYVQMATIATDEHHTLQEFHASVGAQWPFLSDPGASSRRTSTSRSTPTPTTTR
jgi:peroxiredoxin